MVKFALAMLGARLLLFWHVEGSEVYRHWCVVIVGAAAGGHFDRLVLFQHPALAWKWVPLFSIVLSTIFSFILIREHGHGRPQTVYK